jgi:hypothetical protein
MCRIEGCGAKPVARGLCAKHYMRRRRQGSPDKVGKPGRPRSALLECLRDQQREWERKRVSRRVSPRTLTRRAQRYRLQHARFNDATVMARIEGPLTGRERAMLVALLEERRGAVDIAAMLEALIEERPASNKPRRT